MTHIEITTRFALLNLHENDLVILDLVDGSEVTGLLSSKTVSVDLDDNNEYINSRIGLLPPPPPLGMIAPRIITTFYSVNILNISRG
jgi:hypothetical protein